MPERFDLPVPEGWTKYGGSEGGLWYRKAADSLVVVTISVYRSDDVLGGTTAGTLPEGFRPETEQLGIASSINNSVPLTFACRPNGTIYIYPLRPVGGTEPGQIPYQYIVGACAFYATH